MTYYHKNPRKTLKIVYIIKNHVDILAQFKLARTYFLGFWSKNSRIWIFTLVPNKYMIKTNKVIDDIYIDHLFIDFTVKILNE